MTHEQNPIPQNLQPIDQQAELAYGQELASRFVQESVGTVGMYGSMDFSNEEKQHMHSVISARNPNKTLPQPSGRGGFNDYGERPILGSSDPFAATIGIRGGKDTENLQFITLPDGKVDVRYGFNSRGYFDATDRPDNVLAFGFVLPAESAGQLWDTVHKDPSFVREVIKGQALALGVSEDTWRQKLNPRYDRYEEPGTFPKGAALTISNLDKNEHDVVPFSRRGSIITTAAETGLDEEAYTEEFKKELHNYIANNESFADPTDLLSGLASEYIGYNRTVLDYRGPETRELREAVCAQDASIQIYEEYFSKQLANSEDPHGFIFGYVHKTMQEYVDAAMQSGAKPDDIKNPVAMAENVSPSADIVAAELMLIDESLRYTKYALQVGDFAKILDDIRASRRQQTRTG